MEWPFLSCVACHDLVEAIKKLHELKIYRLRVVRRRAERDAGTSRAERNAEPSRAERDPEPNRAERDPEPSCHECMEWPFLSCVACLDLVEAIKELHELDIYRLRVVRRRPERDPGLSFHECMKRPLLSSVAGLDLVGAIQELHRIYRLPEVPRLAERDAEPSFDELKEWLRLILIWWKL